MTTSTLTLTSTSTEGEVEMHDTTYANDGVVMGVVVDEEHAQVYPVLVHINLPSVISISTYPL